MFGRSLEAKSKRFKTVTNALKKWNNDFGSHEGVVAYVGTEEYASLKLFALDRGSILIPHHGTKSQFL